MVRIAKHVDDGVQAAELGGRALGDVPLAVVECDVGAELTQQCVAGWACRGGDSCAEVARDLQREETDSAGCAVDQNRLSGSYREPVRDDGVGGRTGKGHGELAPGSPP